MSGGLFFCFGACIGANHLPMFSGFFLSNRLRSFIFFISGILFFKSFSSLFRFFKFDLRELLHYGPILSTSTSFTGHFKKYVEPVRLLQSISKSTLSQYVFYGTIRIVGEASTSFTLIHSYYLVITFSTDFFSDISRNMNLFLFRSGRDMCSC